MGANVRRRLTFPCAGVTLHGALDEGERRTGLFVVSGGNQIMAGAHRGMAHLAARVAEAGYPVFRFDRRGIGDSEGENGEYLSSAPDLAAALAAFRAAAPHVARIVGFGNCDGAAALLLHRHQAPCDALILANPWSFDEPAAGPGRATSAPTPTPMPAATIRARYRARLADPRQWLRLLRGDVDLHKLRRGLSAAIRPRPTAIGDLAMQLAAALEQVAGPVSILAAEQDLTAAAFLTLWDSPAFAGARARHAPPLRLASASHGFADAVSAAWLDQQVLRTLAAVDD